MISQWASVKRRFAFPSWPAKPVFLTTNSMTTSDAKSPTEPLRGSDLVREMGLWKLLREDFVTHEKEISRPGFWAVVVYRWGTWAQILRPRPLKWFMLFFYVIGQRFVRNVYGIEIERTVHIGRRFRVAHQSAIVIHKFARIGDDVMVRQNVTFGMGTTWDNDIWPTIGNRVEFSPGAVVIGQVTIGDDVSVGPNCVITTNISSGRTLFVPPPRSFPKDLSKQQATSEAADETTD